LFYLGAIFACAHSKSISIYNTYSYELIGVLKGHAGLFSVFIINFQINKIVL
jgi:hypothetical protein